MRQRIPCELRCGDATGRGFVTDLSTTGLYVQTSFYPSSTEISVRLRDPGPERELSLRTRVVRWFMPDPRLRSVLHAGLALRIVGSPRAFRTFVTRLFCRAPR